MHREIKKKKKPTYFQRTRMSMNKYSTLLRSVFKIIVDDELEKSSNRKVLLLLNKMSLALCENKHNEVLILLSLRCEENHVCFYAHFHQFSKMSCFISQIREINCQYKENYLFIFWL